MISAKAKSFCDELLFWRNDALCRKILSGVLTVGLLTAGVKAVAFVKELLVASQFGTSHVMDAFTSAFVIWTFVVSLIGGALPDALVPVYAKVRTKSERAARKLALGSIWIYFAQILGLTLLVLLCGQLIVPLFTREYSPEKQQLTLHLFRLLAPFSLLWGMSHLMTALLQARKRFVLASLAPACIPASAILALAFCCGPFGIQGLVFGILAGAALQLGLLFAGYFRGFSATEIFRPNAMWTPEMRSVLRTSYPYLLSGLVMGSVLLVDVGMAAWLDPGSVSALAYAERVCAIGMTLAATATTEAFFPYLSDLVAREQWTKLRDTVIRFSKLIFGVMSLVVAALWIGSDWLVSLLFERNEFTSQDSARVGGILRWLSLQIPFYIMAVLGARVICAMLASKVILLTSCVNLILNIACNYLLIRLMGVEGIALSTSIVYCVSAIMLFAYFWIHSKQKTITETKSEQ